MYCTNCGIEIEEEGGKSQKKPILAIMLIVLILIMGVCLLIQFLRNRGYTQTIHELKMDVEKMEDDMRYYKVELPREDRDIELAHEILDAVKTACGSVDAVYYSLSDEETVTVRNGSMEASTRELEQELSRIYDFDSIEFKSKRYSKQTYTIRIENRYSSFAMAASESAYAADASTESYAASVPDEVRPIVYHDVAVTGSWSD